MSKHRKLLGQVVINLADEMMQFVKAPWLWMICQFAKEQTSNEKQRVQQRPVCKKYFEERNKGKYWLIKKDLINFLKIDSTKFVNR